MVPPSLPFPPPPSRPSSSSMSAMLVSYASLAPPPTRPLMLQCLKPPGHQLCCRVWISWLRLIPPSPQLIGKLDPLSLLAPSGPPGIIILLTPHGFLIPPPPPWSVVALPLPQTSRPWVNIILADFLWSFCSAMLVFCAVCSALVVLSPVLILPHLTLSFSFLLYWFSLGIRGCLLGWKEL